MKKLSIIAAALLAVVGLARSAEAAIEKMYLFDCGTIALFDASSFTPGASGPGTLAVTCYLIKHGQNWVLFDTGLGDHIINLPEGQKSPAGVWTIRKTLTAQLAELGLKPSDVTHLILSHSHPDHVGNLALFSGATLVVQKAEYDWKDPMGMSRFKPEQKALTPSGDFDLFGDGSITLISTPGHSPGHQNLLVKLPKSGAIMLTGDSVHTKANWDSKRVPERNFNVPQSLASIEKMIVVLKDNNAQLWIGHEPTDPAQHKYSPAFYD